MMPAATYLPFPTYPVIPANADDVTIGSCVLRYVISEGTTGVLTTRELELADIAGKRAVCGHGKEPGAELAHIQAARDIITRSLLRRHAEERAAEVKPVEQPVNVAEQALDEVAQLSREEQIALLLQELLTLAGHGPKPEIDGGLGAKLKPVVPKLPPGSIGLVPGHAA
jgi:hypothetical protein